MKINYDISYAPLGINKTIQLLSLLNFSFDSNFIHTNILINLISSS